MNVGSRHVAGAPGLDQLRLRHFQGEADYPNILAILKDSELADGKERDESVAAIARTYGHLANCDPYLDMVFAEVAGKAVGYSRGWWWDEPDEGRVYGIVGFVAGEWRRQGIGSAMLRWVEDRLREVAASHTEGVDRWFQVGAYQSQVGLMVMLEHCGYEPVRYTVEMLRPSLDDILDSPLPEGIELRRVRPEHYRQIWRAVDATSRDEWGYVPTDEDDYQDWLSQPHFQPDLWQIAWDAATDEVAGHLLTFIDHATNAELHQRRGLTEGLGVDRKWRGLGLARALIARSLGAQHEAGMTESALVVDADSVNGALTLYESAGFQVTQRNAVYRKPL